MSLLDRIKGTGPTKPDAEPAGRLTRPFDELSPGNAMEATARFGPGGDDTRGDTRNAGTDSALLSIISAASPSEAAGESGSARAGQPGAQVEVGSGLPVIGVAGGAMVDRVTPDIGRIGPVDDAEAMARNICEVWAGDPRGMGQESWRHAQQFSWRESMHALFGELYPRALQLAAQRALVPQGARSPRVDARGAARA